MNGGQFSYSFAEPLSSPSMPRHLPAMFCGRQPALKIRFGAFPQVLPWGLQFLINCNAEKYAENTKSVLSLAKLSREEMKLYTRTQTQDFNFRETGKLHLYKESLQLQRASSLVALKNRLGYKQEVWNREQCLSREPALKKYQGSLAGGIFSPLDQSGDTFKLIQRLTEYCLQTGRCGIVTKVEINGLYASNGTICYVNTSNDKLSADAYVLCAGAESARLIRTLGEKLPIVPVKGYSVTFPALLEAPEINLTDTHHKIVFTKLGEYLRVAGMMEFAGQNLLIRKDRIEYLIQLARSLLPQAGDYEQLLACWTGLRPMTPDGVPIIGPSRWKNLWFNTGHGMLGSTLAFGSARLIADQIDGADCEINPASYQARRFEKKFV